MTDPTPVGDPVRNVVRRLEAERMTPAPAVTPQEQLDADFRELIGLIAAELARDAARRRRGRS